MSVCQLIYSLVIANGRFTACPLLLKGQCLQQRLIAANLRNYFRSFYKTKMTQKFNWNMIIIREKGELWKLFMSHRDLQRSLEVVSYPWFHPDSAAAASFHCCLLGKWHLTLCDKNKGNSFPSHAFWCRIFSNQSVWDVRGSGTRTGALRVFAGWDFLDTTCATSPGVHEGSGWQHGVPRLCQ